MGAVDPPGGGRRRRRHPRVPGRRGAKARHRHQHPVRQPRPVGGLGLGHRHLDGAHRAQRHDPGLPRPVRVLRQRLLQLRRGLHPGPPRPGGFHRHPGPPAVLARGSRLRRTAGGGDRQWCHRDHPGACHGAPRRQGHHAAALPHLRRQGSPGPSVDRVGPQGAAAAVISRHRQVAQRLTGVGGLVPVPQIPQHDEVDPAPQRHQMAAGGLSGGRALQAQLQPVGSTGLPGCRRRPVRGDHGRPASRSRTT